MLNVTHAFGVKELSLFKDFPYFDSCKQLPQETIQNYVDQVYFLIFLTYEDCTRCNRKFGMILEIKCREN